MKNKFGHIVLLFGITAMAFGIYRGEVGIVLRKTYLSIRNVAGRSPFSRNQSCPPEHSRLTVFMESRFTHNNTHSLYGNTQTIL